MCFFFVFFFKQKTAYEISACLVGSEMCIRDSGAIGIIQGTTSVFPGYPRLLQISGSKGSATLEEDSILRWDTVDGKVPEGIILGRTKASGASDPKAIGMEGHKLQIEDMMHACCLLYICYDAE